MCSLKMLPFSHDIKIQKGSYTHMKSVSNCRKWLFCALACFFTAFLIAVSANTCKQEEDASLIAPYVLRFHILAESNSKTDQELKLKVRDQVLSYIRENAPGDAGKEELASWLLDHKDDIILKAEQTLASSCCDADVDLDLSHDHFPARTYGNAFFPCGYYDAARITIGKGKGRNWWCVLYPGLCFPDPDPAVKGTVSGGYSLVFETAPRPELHLGLIDAAKQLFKQKA